MLKEKLTEEMKNAMRARDMGRLGMIRMLLSEIKNFEIDKGSIDDDGVITVLKSERKKMRDAIDQYKAAGREDTVEVEAAKLAVIEEFLPEEMSKEAIEKIVDEVLAAGADDFGKIMGQVMGKTKGQADGQLVKEVVSAKLP